MSEGEAVVLMPQPLATLTTAELGALIGRNREFRTLIDGGQLQEIGGS